MATLWGKKYAAKVHDGTLAWPEEVPEKRRWETYNAYVELGYKPDIEPPEE
ncbi:MAG TPA: hypothetical protein O0X39_01350 [Methanocorpusculum sp.]|nr:hypothetical protein [Methanocorpusculum sp.]